MRRFATLITSVALTMSGLVFSPAQAKVTKPSAPTVSAVSSSTPKKGKVNVTVTITLPTSNGGSKITGSRVTAGGKTCTIAKTKTSCTIKSIKNGKLLSVYANSKNIKGFGAKSARVTYIAGASSWPSAQVAPVVAAIPAVSSPASPAAPAPLTCATGGTCVVGNTGPGGGIVFYISPTPNTAATPWRYMEVAPSTWNGGADSKMQWWACISAGWVKELTTGSTFITSNTMAAVGKGSLNTKMMFRNGLTLFVAPIFLLRLLR